MALEPPAWAEKKYATVAALVRGECANHRPSKVEPTPELCIDRDEPCCLLADEPEACGYFERCLLPAVPTVDGRRPLLDAYAKLLATDDPHTPGFARQETLDMWRLYMQREARQCECGRPLKPRHRRCDRCVREGRRARDRAKKRRTRAVP